MWSLLAGYEMVVRNLGSPCPLFSAFDIEGLRVEARVSFIGPALHASSIRVDLGATFRDRKTLLATVTTVTKTLESLCPRFYRASHKYASTFPAPVQLGFGPLDFFNAPNLAFWCCKTATGFALFGKKVKS